MSEILGHAPSKAYILVPVFLNILINIIYLILDVIKIFQKNDKNKMTSLEKFLFPLSIIEILVSLFICISGFLPFDKINGNPSECKIVGCFQIFFYIFEISSMYMIISHLKHLIMNPLNYILKSNTKLIKNLLIISAISLSLTLVCFFVGIIGKSPMNTCFFKYEHLQDDEDFEKKIILVIILIYPLFVIGFIVYKIIILTQSDQYKNDTENKVIFKNHIVYLFSYSLTSIFFPILYFTYALSEKNTDLNNFYFAMTMIIVIASLLIGILKFYKNKLNPSKNKIFRNLSAVKNKSLGLIEIGETPEEGDEKEQFESSAIRKFVMNFYISVCFCLEKNLFSTSIVYKDLTEEMNNETNKYTISPEIISKELPSGQLVKDVMVESREKFSIICEEYAPKIFSYLRQLDKVSEDVIINSMLPMNNKIGIKETEGRGGSFFINSDDYEFSIKTITEQEFKIMVRLLQNKMVDYFKKNDNSIICRIYGVYKISIKTGYLKYDETYFILMKNVIGSFLDNLLCKYDLKGSSFNRKVTTENVDTKVLKDINFNEVEEVFLLNKVDSQKLLTIVEKDVNFLCSSGIMDYSLLVAKITLNNDEINSLFGRDHRKATEAQFLQMIGQERMTLSNNPIRESLEGKKEIDNNDVQKEDKNLIEDYREDKIRFKEGNIAPLKKYMFPSLKADIVYLMSIIDYFQIFNLQKNLENKYKNLKKGVKREDISSLPPDEYKERFIAFVRQKTDSEQLLKNIYGPKNNDDQ